MFISMEILQKAKDVCVPIEGLISNNLLRGLSYGIYRTGLSVSVLETCHTHCEFHTVTLDISIYLNLFRIVGRLISEECKRV